MNKKVQQYGVAIFATMTAVGTAAIIPDETAFQSDGRFSIRVLHRYEAVSKADITLINQDTDKKEHLVTDTFGFGRNTGPVTGSFEGDKFLTRRPGTYTFIVKKEGFLEKKENFFLGEDEFTENTVMLRKPKPVDQPKQEVDTGPVWQERAFMPVSKQNLDSVAFKDRIYTIGGWQKVYLNSVEAYDPQTDTWSKLTPLSIKRDHHTCSVVGNRVFILGGHNHEYYNGISETEIYHPTRDKWSFGPPMPAKRHSHSANVVQTRIFLFGGKGAAGSVAILDTRDLSWSSGAGMPTKRYYHTSHRVGKKIYLIGGRYKRQTLASVDVYDPFRDSWTRRSPMHFPRYAHSGCVVKKKIYIFGGKGGADTVEEYDTERDTWTRKQNMEHERFNTTCTRFEEKIYLMGGAGGGPSLNQVYYPAMDTEFTGE